MSDNIIEKVEQEINHHFETFLGYPCNTKYDYSPVCHLIKMHINNVGCPFSSGNYKANTKNIEQEVLAWFAELWGINKDDMWGVITNGGTESSLQGLYIARESAEGRPHVFLTSKQSHYSIFKIAKILCLNIVLVECQENGEIDYTDFNNKVKENVDKFIIINANLGTTMTGAIDSTHEIYRILRKHGKDKDYYCHADAALAGFFLPFLEKDIFFKSSLNSMAISLHKFMGLPYPAGIFMIEKKFMKYVTNNIEYIGGNDATISGSRNGHTPLFIHYMTKKMEYSGFQNDINICIEMAEYLIKRLPYSWRNQNSITVVFPRPPDAIIGKWQLATQGKWSHIITMPHVTYQQLDAFLLDYISTTGNKRMQHI
jgi:histidine decarboxylase